MTVKKYTDWAGWMDGLKMKVLEAAGTALVTLVGSNGVAAMHIPGLSDVGMNWKTAVGQFLIHILLAAGLYMRDQKPTVITETIETTHLTKDSVTGAVTEGSSKVTTITPVETPKETKP